ncbi:hypothetical protein [Frankia sp. Cr2]|uniref:hypothetical protein n=1 Tax=Frankia sp. Cr2 TaxID=3073932 RepID=UPI002AD401D7|nr:hypothetical protein [Frankia sp. Cr2]
MASQAQVAAVWLARNLPGPRPKDLSTITCAGTGTAEQGAATRTTAAETAPDVVNAACRAYIKE